MDPEELFYRYFLPVYPPDSRADLAKARATDANPARNPALTAHLQEASTQFVANARALFGVDLQLDRTDESVHRLSAALTLERRDEWAARGEPGTAQNVLFNAVVHGSAYVGACIVSSHGGVWGVRRPLWESVVRLSSRAGEADLAVFHWWVKALADGSRASLADRYRTHVEVPCMRPESLPVLADPARSLPRLVRPTYDLLHKYLRAHLPEVRDLGTHFPAPERFAELALSWLDFRLLGGGRLLLLAGLSRHGLHLFWVGASGFDKGVFYGCDPFPEPVVQVQGDRIVVMTQLDGAARVNEMLWWGP
ncbi:MAG TPA: hypothetical protein VKU41_25955 [Polyangiaceae bacterium]|nr:hypothetical protein [Polyangiaceae bacterium]